MKNTIINTIDGLENNGTIQRNLIISVLILAILIFSFTSIFIGVSDISIRDFGQWNESEILVLVVSRLPRLAAILLAGIGMSVAGLIEQQKFVGNKDFILVNFDNNGKFKNYVVLENGKNPFGSYMFSQENKEENEVLFFYRESTKESGKKTYNLVINKLKDGELTQEKLPFKTESSQLNFARAQYGYILVLEYDKDDKESSVRLEKINL